MAVSHGGTNLITLAQYKDFAGLQGVSEDAKINVIIPSVSQAVKTYCGTSFVDFVSSDKTEFFDIKDNFTTAIMLDESPIISVTSVQERDGQSGSYTTLITENSDIVANMNMLLTLKLILYLEQMITQTSPSQKEEKL